MPPALDTPEEVAAALAAVLGVLGVVATGILGAAAAVVTAWRAKVKPLLTSTQSAASHAAEQLTPNHGSTVRDAVRRTEEAVARLDRNTNQRLADLRADMRESRDQNDRAHSELFRRVRALETPMEDTRP